MERRNWNFLRVSQRIWIFAALTFGCVGLSYGETFPAMTPILEPKAGLTSSTLSGNGLSTENETNVLSDSKTLQQEENCHNDSGTLKTSLIQGENSTGSLSESGVNGSKASAIPSPWGNDGEASQTANLSGIQKVNATLDSAQKEQTIERTEYLERKETIIPATKVPSTLPDPDIYLPNNKDTQGSYMADEYPTSSFSKPEFRENSLSESPQAEPEVIKVLKKPVVPDVPAEPQTIPVQTQVMEPPSVPIPVPAESDNVPTIAPLATKPVSPAYTPKNGEVDGSNPQMFRDDYDYMQLRSELLGEIEKHAWRSGEFQVIPYGYFWASVSYESNPTQIGSCPFYVKSPDNTGNQTHVDYRGSIFGANILGPQIAILGDAKVRGKIEFDLQRTIDYENKTSLHLRHCYVEAMNENYRILIGQTWDVISPLAPGTLMYSAGWQDGNVGYRRAQVRLERFCNVHPHFQIKFQGCLSAPFAGDSTDELNLCGEKYRIKTGSYPIVQGRVATVFGCRKSTQKPIEFGLSGHIGEIQYGHINAGQEDNNYKVKTWGVYFDAYLPINSYIGFQGELFKGENLAMFLGGIGQGAMLSVDKTPEAIQAQGGWLSMWVNVTDKTQLRVGYMIDDPTNDVSHLTSDADFSGRTLNHSLFANVKYNITPQWWVGTEYSHIETAWVGKNAGVSRCDRIDLVSYFGF